MKLYKGTKAPVRIAEVGGDVIVGIDAGSPSFTLALDPAETAPDGSANHVAYFDSDVSSVKLYLDTVFLKPGDASTRIFADGASVDLKNSDVMLVFGVNEHAQSGGKDRLWPNLVACVGVADDQIQAWQKQLDASEKGPLAELRARIESGRSRMMGVKLDGKSGWTHEKSTNLIKQSPPPQDKARRLCEVDVKDGGFVLVEAKSATGPSPWEVGDIASIYPFETQENKAGVATVAVFEMMIEHRMVEHRRQRRRAQSRAGRERQALEMGDGHRAEGRDLEARRADPRRSRAGRELRRGDGAPRDVRREERARSEHGWTRREARQDPEATVLRVATTTRATTTAASSSTRSLASSRTPNSST